MSLAYRPTIVYPQISKAHSLRYLLIYATTHRHSHQWVAPLNRLLAKKGGQALD